jgi:hypothetical protein
MDYSDIAKKVEREKQDKEIYGYYLDLIKSTRSFFTTGTALSFSYGITFEQMQQRLEEIESILNPNR